ncbi:triphosphoribosyl-dephospho-CoA synthase [Desulfosporosinus lacus]|uniref:Triphosphoribosyl-dephospho-CoA synthase n=1 Tax=Desulfosporosinus lacus DSM 15449 TaxID=1121420 RepID=A0A1M6A0I2_9FIRM|nr:triphosphoribosyl-dephospho-CoA synthase [Desulfosporosinus lacus]SHI29906.1 triphosphoribosyl-dephospho-CoA synthase [Desulfosporosinus lacus DSM 15449]
MPYEDFRWDIAGAAQAACILEANAPKVGNVNRLNDFEDCTLEDFHLSAVAIAEPLGRVRTLGVGKTIRAAIQATRQAVPTNTNLGMVLLLVPLAMAWSRMEQSCCQEKVGDEEKKESQRAGWAREIAHVLTGLTAEDTRHVYEAIRLANPSGMGHTGEHDIYKENPPNITLLEAMSLAANRDMVALEYANQFQTVFKVGLPALEQALKVGLSLPDATAGTHLFLLSQFPDTLIARKGGESLSRQVQARAQRVWEAGGFRTDAGRTQAAEFDAWLREDGHHLNPGSTADLIAVILFVLFLENGLGFWGKNRRDRGTM